MPLLVGGQVCINFHREDHHRGSDGTMHKYEEDFVLQAAERSEGPCALRKQALLVKVHVCTVCGYVELYAEKNRE